MCLGGGSKAPPPPPPPVEAPPVLEQPAPEINTKQQRMNRRKRHGHKKYSNSYRNMRGSQLGGIPKSGRINTTTP